VAGLLGGGRASTNGTAGDLPPGLASLPEEQATAIAQDILGRASLPVEGGARQPRDIIQRLLDKARRPDPTDQVRAAFEFVGELHRAAGSPNELGSRLRPLLEARGLSTEPVDEVLSALNLLEAYGPISPEAEVQVDLSLARGLRYYTGLVFEIYVDSEDGPLQLCGGGRYDDLVRALGGRDAVPACGFQYGLERLDLAASHQDALQKPRVLVVGVTGADHPSALAVARRLREVDGLVVEQDVRMRGVKSALRHADRAGMDLVVIIGELERQDDVAVVRDMRSRQETRVALDDLVGSVRSALT
jgi:histidyl-tRNA synthetase